MRLAWTRPIVFGLLAVVGVRAAGDDPPTFAVPNVPDLTIKTLEAGDSASTTQIIKTLYFKGAWQRRETQFRFPPGSAQAAAGTIFIARCDDRRSLTLNPDAKVYVASPMVFASNAAMVSVRATKAWSEAHVQQLTGAEVRTIVNTVDTGERRKVGSYTARHVIKTTTTSPSPGAGTPRSESVEDGWYIDLPPVGCVNQGDTGALGQIFSGKDGNPDRVTMEFRGEGRQGFPIEETKRTRADHGSYASTVTLLEFSDAALDKSLFDVPKGYRPALRRLGGRVDFTQPDTYVNRISAFVEDVGDYARSWFRF